MGMAKEVEAREQVVQKAVDGKESKATEKGERGKPQKRHWLLLRSQQSGVVQHWNTVQLSLWYL